MRGGGQWACFDRRLGRVEHRRGRLGRRHDVRRAPTRRERDPAVRVARGERLVLRPGDGHRSDPRHGAQRVHHPVREALRQVHRRVGAHPGQRGRELSGRQIDLRARRPARVGSEERDVERALPELEPDRRGGRLEGHVHPAHPGGAAGPLQVRDGRHHAIGEGRRLVLSLLAAEAEDRHALLLSIGSRRERRVVVAHDELVIVADGGAREIVGPEDLDRAAVGGDAHAGAPNVARVLARAPSEEERPATGGEVRERSPDGCQRMASGSTVAPPAAWPSPAASAAKSRPGAGPRAMRRREREPAHTLRRAARANAPTPSTRRTDRSPGIRVPRRECQGNLPVILLDRRMLRGARAREVSRPEGQAKPTHEPGARRRQQRQEVVPSHGADARGPPGGRPRRSSTAR